VKSNVPDTNALYLAEKDIQPTILFTNSLFATDDMLSSDKIAKETAKLPTADTT
jgi:hypothetical protein